MLRPVSPLPLLSACLTAALLLSGCATGPASDASLAPLEAYRLRTVELPIGTSVIALARPQRAPQLDDAELMNWASGAAHAVQTYYGGFPVRRVQVVVDAVDGHGPQSGTAFGFNTPLIRITVGRATGPQDLAQDWMLTHEMVHLAFPRVAQQHHWLEEGLATYVEPIARVQAGQLPAEQVWRDLVAGLPYGLPQPGDRGLDRTPTWGRTYWGGALFCLRADIEIRKQTGNRYGLQDALRGIVGAGGNIGVIWSVDRALKAGDAAVGVDVLTQLYEEMGPAPVDVNLDELWVQLGVVVRGGEVVFDDSAPLAPIRRAITAPPRQADRAL